MKKKGIIICSIIGVVLIVGGILLLLLLSPKKSNKQLYTEAIQKSLGLKEDGVKTEKVDDLLKKLEDEIGNKYYKVSISGTSTKDEASFTKTEESIYFGKDKIYINTSENINDVIHNIEIMLKNNKLYLKYENLLDNIYYLDKIDQYFNSSATEDETIKKIVEYLSDSLSEAIKNEDVNIDSKELTINGNKYDTKSYSYTFTGESLYDVIVSFVDKIKKDENVYKKIIELVKEISKTTEIPEISQEDFNQMLDQAKEMAKELKSLGNLFTYAVYMYKDDVASRQITVNIPSEQGKLPISVEDYIIDGYYKAAVSTMGYDVFALELKKQDDTKTNISLSSMAQEILTGYFKNDSNGVEIKLEGAMEGMDSLFYMDFDKKTGRGNIEIKSESSKSNYEYIMEEVDEIPEMNVSGSLPFEDITEEDKEKVEKFLGKFMPSYNNYFSMDNGLLEG